MIHHPRPMTRILAENQGIMDGTLWIFIPSVPLSFSIVSLNRSLEKKSWHVPNSIWNCVKSKTVDSQWSASLVWQHRSSSRACQWCSKLLSSSETPSSKLTLPTSSASYSRAITLEETSGIIIIIVSRLDTDTPEMDGWNMKYVCQNWAVLVIRSFLTEKGAYFALSYVYVLITSKFQFFKFLVF